MGSPTRGNPSLPRWRPLFPHGGALSLLSVELNSKFTLSWVVAVRTGRESSDGNAWDGWEDQDEVGLKFQTPLTSPNGDLRWVPPWPPWWLGKSNRWLLLTTKETTTQIEGVRGERWESPVGGGRSVAEGWSARSWISTARLRNAMVSKVSSADGISDDGKGLRNQGIYGSWRFLVGMKTSEKTEQTSLKARIWRALAPEVSDQLKFQFFLSDVWLNLSLAADRIPYLVVGFSWFSSDVFIEELTRSVAGLVSCDWVFIHISSLVGCVMSHNALTQLLKIGRSIGGRKMD